MTSQQLQDLMALLMEALPEREDALINILYGERCATCDILAPGGKCKHHLEEL